MSGGEGVRMGRVGPTIALFGGGVLDLCAPDPAVITARSIAHALSMLCRFTGHSRWFYSVAEHSVHCSYLVPPEHAFAALMHDAAEAFVGDVSRPLKMLLPEYRWIEKRIELAVAAKFDLPSQMPAAVKEADLLMLKAEQEQVMDRGREAWDGLEDLDAPALRIEFWSPVEAERMFMGRFRELSALRIAREEFPAEGAR